MRVRSRIAWSLVVALFPAFVLAAPCSGFTDVDDTHNFCPNVDWLKNRGITLGCTSTTAYCPDAPVTRLQMAAFMNRLGTAFTPIILYEGRQGHAMLSNLSGGEAYVCMTGDVAIFDFRRFVTAISTVTPLVALSPTLETIASRPVISTDAGVTWQSFDPIDTTDSNVVHSIRVPGSRFTTATAITREAAIFQASYRFAIEIFSAWSSSVDYKCQLRVSITNRNGGNVPY